MKNDGNRGHDVVERMGSVFGLISRVVDDSEGLVG